MLGLLSCERSQNTLPANLRLHPVLVKRVRGVSELINFRSRPDPETSSIRSGRTTDKWVAKRTRPARELADKTHRLFEPVTHTVATSRLIEQ